VHRHAAASQLQLDVRRSDGRAAPGAQGIATEDASPGYAKKRRHLETCWQEPDEGLWEVRGPRRRFTHSKVMCWVAFDRGIKAAEQYMLPGPVPRWREVRARIHDDVCRRAWRPKLGHFAQSYGSDDLDASLLLIPMTGFLPCSDPRVRSTIEAVQRDLTLDGFVQRYRTRRALDGLPPGGVFLACSSGSRTRCACSTGTTRRARYSGACSGWSTTLACSPRNTIRRRSGCSEISAGLFARGAGQYGDEPERTGRRRSSARAKVA
jgi:hypothetical protein